MATRRKEPPEVPPDLPPQKAHSVLSAQLTALQQLKGRKYSEAGAAEDQWYQFTEKLILRSFGSSSTNLRHFRNCLSSGVHTIAPFYDGYGSGSSGLDQSNFEARLQCYEGVINSCLSELELDFPQWEIKGVYEPGQEYEFYRDLKSIVTLAQREIFAIDPYLDAEIFDVYAGSIPRTVSFRLLSNNIPPNVKLLAQKYASGGNLQFRTSTSIHDRVVFVDSRVWLSGQSIKDAARSKPTYIVEHDEASMREVYERLWKSASPVI